MGFISHYYDLQNIFVLICGKNRLPKCISLNHRTDNFYCVNNHIYLLVNTKIATFLTETHWQSFAHHLSSITQSLSLLPYSWCILVSPFLNYIKSVLVCRSVKTFLVWVSSSWWSCISSVFSFGFRLCEHNQAPIYLLLVFPLRLFSSVDIICGGRK